MARLLTTPARLHVRKGNYCLGGIGRSFRLSLRCRKLYKGDAKESKRIIFVGLVVEPTNVEVVVPDEVHELLNIVDLFGGLVVLFALFLDVGVYNT